MDNINYSEEGSGLSDFLKYKYKLNYIDFLKLMVSSDLYDLEKYLFLQSEPVEIEVYFEEVLLSVNHGSFKIGNMPKFMNMFYSETEAIVETLLEKDAKEFFKIQTIKNKDYVYNLLLCYRDLVKETSKIQEKLLSKIRKEYIPITITVNSYILNRIATTYTEQFTGNKILLSDAKEDVGVSEAQIRDLHVNMVCMTPYLGNTTDLKKDFRLVFTSKVLSEIEKYSDKVRIYTMDALKNLELYASIVESDYEGELGKWMGGQMVNINAPYYGLQSRNLTSDWNYKKCRMPSDLKLI